ncbi:heterochromatin protein 1-binding protein 3 [Aplochiton taeniatus]
MPIRRAAGTPPQETAPSTVPEGGSDPTTEESASLEVISETAAPASDTAAAKEGEGSGEAGAEGETAENRGGADGVKEEESTDEKADNKKNGEDDEKKDDKDGVKEKVKKVKRTVPAWATISGAKKVPVTNFTGSQPRVDDILIEAVQSCKERTGTSCHSVMKYIAKKYPGHELDKRKFLLKNALKRQVEKGTIKQLRGKGLSGSFAIGKPPQKPTAKPTANTGLKSETLGDALPLIITRLCEPKEASYILIKKYVEQHFPQLNVENRPDLLKGALLRAVDKGYLEQLTGKGASGTFQLKRVGDKSLLKGGSLEEAIMTAITAMNEPKTCSTTILRKYLIDTNKDITEARVVTSLKRTLQKCKMMGWMEQITGNGLTGTYQLSFPYYPSPAILFPDKHQESQKKQDEAGTKRKRRADSDSESDEESEEESEEESSEDDEPPPPKRKAPKRPAAKARRPPPSKKSSPARKSLARGKRPAPAKRTSSPAKKPVPPVKKSPARKQIPPTKKPVTPAKKPVTPAKKPVTPAKKPVTPAKKARPPPPPKATPVKKAAPASKPKTPVVKKMTSRGSKRPVAKKSPPAKPAAKTAVKTKPSARKSQRGRK